MLTTKSLAIIAGIGVVGVIAMALGSFAQIKPRVGTNCSGYVTGSFIVGTNSTSYIVNNCSGDITYVENGRRPLKAK